MITYYCFEIWYTWGNQDIHHISFFSTDKSEAERKMKVELDHFGNDLHICHYGTCQGAYGQGIEGVCHKMAIGDWNFKNLRMQPGISITW